MPGGGVGVRAGPEPGIPPPPQLKMVWGPATPPPDPDRVPPTQGYLGGTPPPFSQHSVTSESQLAVSYWLGDPPIPPAFSG
ncbi:MAG: hypothetical protein STSR0009_30620 [Methanoregula sp.]